MRNLKLKTICNVAAMAVHAELQNPLAPLGEIGTIRTVEITDIPEGVENWQVVKAWRETADISYLGNDLKYPRHTYAFSEIGNGRIIRGKAS